MNNRKIKWLLCFIFLISLSANAQFANPVKILDGGTNKFPINFIVGDFTNDGSVDVVSQQAIVGDLFLLNNTNNGQMTLNADIYQDQSFALQTEDYHTFYSGDFNGDNIPDLYSLGEFFVWLKNDGTGNFTFGDSIPVYSYSDYRQVVDLDNDGWNDIIYLSESASELMFLKNNGDDTFEFPVSLQSDTTFDYISSFKLLDYNSDNLPDLFVSFYDKIEIYLQNPNNSFSFLDRILYDESGFELNVLDFDGDSDIDIIGVISEKAVLFKNQGTSWSTENLLVLEDDSYFFMLQITDIDNNSKNDIIALEYYTDESYNSYNRINIYSNWENQFEDTIQVIDTTTILNFRIEEIDNNNSLDLVFLKMDFSGVEDQFSNIGWIANEDLLDNDIESDNSNNQFGSENLGTIKRNVLFENINSDNETELIFTKTTQALTNKLVLADGTPLNEVFTENLLFENNVIDINDSIAPKLIIDDVNGDNFKDLVHQVGKYKYATFMHNGVDGLSETPIITTIDSTSLLDFKLFGLSDKEGDGDLDLYTSFKFSDGWRLVWLLNNGTGTFDSYSLIDTNPFSLANGFKDAQLGDFDGDSDLDLIANANETIVWYKNDGNGNFGSSNILPNIEPGKNSSIEVVDVNYDGKDEVFLYSYSEVCITHVCFDLPKFNTYGFNTSSGLLEVTNFNNSWPLVGTDIDFDLVYEDFNGDGNLDILTLKLDEGKLIVLLGDGLGNFTNQVDVMTSSIFQFAAFDVEFKVGLYLTDIEGDGDNDIIFLKSTSAENGVYLIENKEIDLGVDLDEDGIALYYDCNDADSTILDTLQLPQILANLQNCEGDEILFEITNLQNVDYSWQTPSGSNSNPSFEIASAAISDAGNYSVQATINQCQSEVSTVVVNVSENPEVSIELLENTLSVVTNDINLGIQWFLNGIAIPGATENTYTPTETGDYHVEVMNENGCEATSEIFQHVVSGLISNNVIELKLYPNPVKQNGKLHINKRINSIDEATYYITNISGQNIQSGNLNSNQVIQIKDYAAGSYFLTLIIDDEKSVGYFMIVE